MNNVCLLYPPVCKNNKWVYTLKSNTTSLTHSKIYQCKIFQTTWIWWVYCKIIIVTHQACKCQTALVIDWVQFILNLFRINWFRNKSRLWNNTINLFNQTSIILIRREISQKSKFFQLPIRLIPLLGVYPNQLTSQKWAWWNWRRYSMILLQFNNLINDCKNLCFKFSNGSYIFYAWLVLLIQSNWTLERLKIDLDFNLRILSKPTWITIHGFISYFWWKIGLKYINT